MRTSLARTIGRACRLPAEDSSHLSDAAAALQQCSRWYCSSPEAMSDTKDAGVIGNEKVRQLAAEIMGLTVLECSWLSEVLRKELNMQKPAFGGMPMPMMIPGMAAPGGTSPGADAAPAAPQEAKEKTEFDVKLESFTPEGKIKVIKEIRALTNLGLKEAKELVEKAPTVIKTGVSKADAEAMQKQLEAVGAKVALD